jgi:outer membrane protein OmpA-like peptidoglycan-associated protein
MVRKKYNWTNSPYLDLYEAKANSVDAHPFSKELNSVYHEGPATFTRNRDTIIFTRSNYFESHLRKSSDGINKLSLFMANWDNLQKKWANIHPLSLNNDQYSMEHPALSEDGKSLYFASDRPGGFGGMDLYVSREIVDGNGAKTWGEAVNLGSVINSPGDDAFPFVDKQGNLWFASNGIPGLGGLDIFFAGKTDNGFAAAINPGYPMNTRFDDFGYITNGEGENGYLSSNRNNSYHDDDIYSVIREFRKVPILVYDARTKRILPSAKLDVLEEGAVSRMIDNPQAAPVVMAFNPFRSYQIGASSAKYKAGKMDLTRDQLRTMDTVKIPLIKEGPSFVLDGRVYTAHDNEPVRAAVVLLTPKSATKGEELTCSTLGLFRTELQPETDYQVKITNPVSKVDCSAALYEISTKGLRKDSAFHLSVPLYCTGDVIQMETIYYDLNKYDIRKDAAKVLDKLLELLNKYPKMQIELRSHTDSRASAEYNLSLSDSRAKAAAEYLYAKGIARQRIVGKGYGESMLINKCSDGVQCTEADHQINRRTEFKILKME